VLKEYIEVAGKEADRVRFDLVLKAMKVLQFYCNAMSKLSTVGFLVDVMLKVAFNQCLCFDLFCIEV
jgi:hypothetical protein